MNPFSILLQTQTPDDPPALNPLSPQQSSQPQSKMPAAPFSGPHCLSHCFP